MSQKIFNSIEELVTDLLGEPNAPETTLPGSVTESVDFLMLRAQAAAQQVELKSNSDEMAKLRIQLHYAESERRKAIQDGELMARVLKENGCAFCGAKPDKDCQGKCVANQYWKKNIP